MICIERSSAWGITVLCHFCKNAIIPVIICKNDKHLVTCDSYHVTFELYLLLTQDGSNVQLK